MDRSARPVKVSKAAAALESLRAVKAGEKKVLDIVGLEDDVDDLEDAPEDDHDDGHESAESDHRESATRKSKAGACTRRPIVL